MSTPEAKVRNPVVKWAKQHGVRHIRNSFRPGVRAGVPDDQFLFRGGISVWVEFKAPGKQPTDLQQHYLEELNALGFCAFWSDNADEACAALTRVLEALAVYEPRSRILAAALRSWSTLEAGRA